MARRKRGQDEEQLAGDGGGAATAAAGREDESGDDTAADEGEADGEEEGEADEPGAESPVQALDVEALAKLSPQEQDEYLASLERKGEDISVIRARLNSRRLKQGAFTAELIRTWPQTSRTGDRVSGSLERWDAPFSEVDIKDHARRYWRGGKYQVHYYDANHLLMHKSNFEIPGEPATQTDVERLKREDPPRPAAPPPSDPGRDSILSGHSAQNEALRDKVRALEMGSVIEAMERRHAEQMARLEALLVAKNAEATKKPSALEILATLGPALAPFVPVFKSYVERGGQSELADVMKMVRDGQADTAKQLREAIEAKRGGGNGGPLEAATTKLVDLAIARTLGDGARHRDPQDLVFKMLEQMLPNIMERAMDIAAMKAPGDGGDDDGKMSPKWALEKFGELMKPVLEQAMGKRAGAGGPASAGMPGMALGMPNPMVPYGYPGMPMMPMVQPTAGVYPYTTAQPVQSMPGQPIRGMPGQVVPASAGQPGQPGQPMMRVPLATAMPGMVPPGMVVPQPPIAMPGQPGQPAAVPAGPAQPPDIDPRLFALMHQALMAGKSGDEVAKVVDDELEAIEKRTSNATPLLSGRAIEILETTPPDLVVQHFFEAAPPDILRLFCDPTGQVAPYALAFTKEFCEFFFDDDEDDAGETPAAAAPVAPATA